MPAHAKISPRSLIDNGEADPRARPSMEELKAEALRLFEVLIGFALEGADDVRGCVTFKDYEQALVPRVFEFGRILLMLFLAAREDRLSGLTPQRLVRDGRTFRRRPAQPRNLNTFFGVVRYWRTYMRGDSLGGEGSRERSGFYPLDVALGLTADRMSMYLVSLATRLATKLSFGSAHATLGWFLLSAPSTEVIEQAVLGLGRRTGEWFERALAPEGDGDVLVIMLDGKASPTATEEELRRRRGKRRPNPYPDSPRHRARDRRQLYGKKPRRKKGDKSKNGRSATMVVMYTLRREGEFLLGPLNRRVYASFAPKRHAFEIARREAEKRGFGRDSGKLIQIVTDGDDDLATYSKEFFPEAIHTIDVMHVVEYLWKAGECLHREGTPELKAWVEKQKERLYGGAVDAIIVELRTRLGKVPVTGPGNKGRRERLEQVMNYLENRKEKLTYAELIERDLEIGSGPVEGAVKHVIGARFDHGGMRWIRERAEALLQLRCIEINGDWERFIAWVHDDMRASASRRGQRLRLQEATPSPLPALAKAA